MQNCIKIQEEAHHRYKVALNCGRHDWKVVTVKAMNEYIALFKALRGELFMALFKIR